jgi:ribonuclease HII
MQKFADMLVIERQLAAEGYISVMGLDEVGRGCLAGPVVAAGVILDPEAIPAGINDSKKLPAKLRVRLAAEIRATARVCVVQHCTPEEIDTVNILWASLQAMERCVLSVNPPPDYLLIDGNRYLPTLTPHRCVIKGDSTSVSIAAASIVAKVYRDEYMARLALEYPGFGWERNVGYPTREHYEGLRKLGITEHHRRSFRLDSEVEYQEKRLISR